MKIREWFVLLAFVLVSEGAGLVGSYFTAPAIPTWYATLAKPEFAPPNWIFAPVWTTLFLLMGIAAFLVWRKAMGSQKGKSALGFFGIQLVFNIFWSYIFFGLQNVGLAFFELVLLWLAITSTILAFARISKRAAWLLMPYLAWVTFAGYLNYTIWILN